MTKPLILCGLAFILLWTPCRALPAASLDGAIYYVALTSDDNNPGTIAYPWQTIQKAANTLTAGDPLFANPAGANFHLRQGSPAIDAGSAVNAPAEDFDGRARPLDGGDDGVAAWDIGAYEAVRYTQYLYLPVILANYRSTSSSWWKPPVGVSWQMQLMAC